MNNKPQKKIIMKGRKRFCQCAWPFCEKLIQYRRNKPWCKNHEREYKRNWYRKNKGRIGHIKTEKRDEFDGCSAEQIRILLSGSVNDLLKYGER